MAREFDDFGNPSPSGVTPQRRGPLVSTRAVETLDGWVGQMLVNSDIVAEGDPTELVEDAVRGIEEFVTERVKAFFTVPLLTSEVEVSPGKDDGFVKEGDR